MNGDVNESGLQGGGGGGGGGGQDDARGGKGEGGGGRGRGTLRKNASRANEITGADGPNDR